MARATAREKLLRAAPSAVFELDGAKAVRFNARTMLVPSPQDIRDAIVKMVPGETKTLNELRSELALKAGADVTCPRATTIGWMIVAEIAEEDRAAGGEAVTPWWRITREGKPDPRVPGGTERHRLLREAEGLS